MSDRLDGLWELQRQQQVEFGLEPDSMPTHERERLLKDLCLGLYEEAQELAREAASHKGHLLKQRPTEKVNVLDEVVDVLKYTITIAQVYDIAPAELYDAFIRKGQVVRDRARGTRLELEKHTKLIISDLDGCIADLSGFQGQLNEARGGAPMNDGMVAALEGLKAQFYRDGGFRHCPVIPGAKEALEQMSRWGYKIVIITARPYWQYKRLYGDTLAWLKENGLKHDLLLFNKDKSEAVYEFIFPAKPVAFIEDRDKHALELVNIGVRVLLMDNAGNRTIPEHPYIHRMAGWTEILNWLESREAENDKALC